MMPMLQQRQNSNNNNNNYNDNKTNDNDYCYISRIGYWETCLHFRRIFNYCIWNKARDILRSHYKRGVMLFFFKPENIHISGMCRNQSMLL